MNIVDQRPLRERPAASRRRAANSGADFRLLAHAITALSSARGKSEIIEIVRRSARGLSGAEGVAVIFGDNGFCNYLVEDSESPLWAGQAFPQTGCVSGWAMMHNETVVIPDIFDDDRIPHDAYRPTFVRSLILTPVGEDKPFAAIGAYWSQTGAPAPEEVQVMEALARSAATAFKNVQLYESLSREVIQRAKSEDHLKLMVNELNHRVKNTLATVQSLAAQSFRNAASVDQAKATFGARLQNLSMIHEMLTEANWEGADLREIATRTMAAHAGGSERARVSIWGPEVQLSPKAASSMAMALNELATNAVKHGALANTIGRIDIDWSVDGPGDAEMLTLNWREHGGPLVLEPAHTGFGHRLLTRGLPAELEGAVELDYAETGVAFTLAAPMAAVKTHGADPAFAL